MQVLLRIGGCERIPILYIVLYSTIGRNFVSNRSFQISRLQYIPEMHPASKHVATPPLARSQIWGMPGLEDKRSVEAGLLFKQSKLGDLRSEPYF